MCSACTGLTALTRPPTEPAPRSAHINRHSDGTGYDQYSYWQEVSISVIEKVRTSNLWTVARVLPRADRSLAFTWWTVLILRGLLPVVFAIAMGTLVGAVQHKADLTKPLALFGSVFVLLQILPPIHRAVGANLGNRTAAWLYDQLTAACVTPPGMGHLENPNLTTELTMARDFDLGITGPPMFISMDFIAGGLVEMVGGLASVVLVASFSWWAAILLAGAWIATHWLLRAKVLSGAIEILRRFARHSVTPTMRTGSL